MDCEIYSHNDTQLVRVEHSISFAVKGVYSCIASKVTECALWTDNYRVYSKPSNYRLDNLSEKIEAYKDCNSLPYNCAFFLGRSRQSAFVIFTLADSNTISGRNVRVASEHYLKNCFTLACGSILGVEAECGPRYKCNASKIKQIINEAGLF